jgi:hypothetical protein
LYADFYVMILLLKHWTLFLTINTKGDFSLACELITCKPLSTFLCVSVTSKQQVIRRLTKTKVYRRFRELPGSRVWQINENIILNVSVVVDINILRATRIKLFIGNNWIGQLEKETSLLNKNPTVYIFKLII